VLRPESSTGDNSVATGDTLAVIGARRIA